MDSPTAPLIANKKYTREEVQYLEALPENADKRFELINGQLYIDELIEGKMPPPSYLHALVISLLVEVLMEYLLKHRVGRLFTDNTGYDLPDGSTLIPDLSVVASDRLLPVVAKGNQYIAPDLAIEVVSPSNTPDKLAQKVQLYLDSGVRLVWVIYPTTQMISVYTPQSDGTAIYQHLSLDGMLTGGDVLPGFTAEIRKIFPFIEG